LKAAGDPKPDAFIKICPSRAVLARVGEKWTLMALVALKNGAKRFGVLQRELEGVSQKMLTQTLRGLERDGLVSRVPHDGRLLRVDYALTSRGRTLVPLALRLKAWAESHLHDIAASNVAYDVRHGRRSTQQR